MLFTYVYPDWCVLSINPFNSYSIIFLSPYFIWFSLTLLSYSSLKVNIFISSITLSIIFYIFSPYIFEAINYSNPWSNSPPKIYISCYLTKFFCFFMNYLSSFEYYYLITMIVWLFWIPSYFKVILSPFKNYPRNNNFITYFFILIVELICYFKCYKQDFYDIFKENDFGGYASGV